MSSDLLVALAATFGSAALFSGLAATSMLSRRTESARRLDALASSPLAVDVRTSLADPAASRFARVPGIVPASAPALTRLRRRLTMAGYTTTTAVTVFGAASMLTPILLAGTALLVLGTRAGFVVAIAAAAIGYLLPRMFLAQRIARRQMQIQNGLPDALDLLVVCIEAGSGLDQAMARVAEELYLAYPDLSGELRTVGTEIRAGKPRLDALKSLAARTKVPDVESLVTLLVQSDRFGTSIAQALRAHADTSRTRRRQRAEERAAKVGVKLVFPLVLFLFPALYIVILGPAAIQFVRAFRPLAGH